MVRTLGLPNTIIPFFGSLIASVTTLVPSVGLIKTTKLIWDLRHYVKTVSKTLSSSQIMNYLKEGLAKIKNKNISNWKWNIVN